jgi:methionyl-tRNA formyltransferase
MTKGQTYFFASSKEWNRSYFNEVARKMPGKWFYVTNDDELRLSLKRQSPRYIFFLHWNCRVPAEIFNRFECVCFHMTDVPYGRGGSPLQNLIIQHHEETMLSALRMDEEIDAGPVYTKRLLSLEGRAEDIYLRAGEVCVDIIQWMIKLEPVPAPQTGMPFLFKRRNPTQSELPIIGDMRTIYNHIRMLDAPGYPLAFIEHGNFRIEFSNAQLVGQEVVAKVVIKTLPKKD